MPGFGLRPRRGNDLWFLAHPKEEFLNHSLATAQARAQRASNPGPPD